MTSSIARDAVIVAGGAGTRLRPLTDATPKPLVEFCGEPFLTGVLRRLAAAGLQRVLLVVGSDAEPFEALQPTASSLGLTLEAVPEPEPLDTAGGVRAVAERLDGPTLVCNGDILTDIDLEAITARHVQTGATATLALTRVRDTSAYGVCVLDGTRIIDFVEKPGRGTLPGQDTVNAGTYVLDPQCLLRFEGGPLSFERAVFPRLVADGERVEGFVWEGAWADLGTPQRLRSGTRMALDGELGWPTVDAIADQGHGVRIAPDAAVADGAHLHGPVLVHARAVVEAGAALGPHVVLGADTHVAAAAELRDTVLGSRTTIGEGVRATGLITGPDVVLPAGVTVLGDTVLGPGVEAPVDEGPLGVGTRVPETAG